MMSRRTLALSVAACAVAAGLATTSAPVYGAGASHGERMLEGLPWSPDVMRIELGAAGPVALTGMYLMDADVLAVDSTGKLVCVARRDLGPRWVATLSHPVAYPPCESPTHYVFVEKDTKGAYWIEAFSRRTGAASEGSPIRVPFSVSSGPAATAATVYVGSLGSPRDNKTFEAINLHDGSVGWGFRTAGRIVGTPQMTQGGEAVVLVSEDSLVASLPANPASSPIAGPLWETKTFAGNFAAPALTKDLMFLGSDDKLLRCYDVHSGKVLWMKGCDGPIRRCPWTLGAQTTKSVASAAEGGAATSVESYEGFVFAKNEVGLHCFDARSGDEVFKDAGAMRPVVKVGDWVVTMTDRRSGQLRKGKGLPVTGTIGLEAFDFVPTNSKDGVLFVGTANGTILAASPK